MMPRLINVAIGLAIGVSTAGGTAPAKPVDDGRKLAIQACSACHQVVPQQKRPAPVAEGEEGTHTEAPTFHEIANRCPSADELRSKISNPHYPMREQLLMPVDVGNLAIYIRSLAARPDCPIR